MIDPVDFRTAMSRLGAAVNIVTTDGPAGRYGMTASAVCSVTDDPPMLLLCVNRMARANAILKTNGTLCVNILSAEQEEVSRRFSNKGLTMDARFAADGAWSRLANGAPALRSALAAIGCAISSVSEVGSHSVFFARAEQLLIGERTGGLVYFDRAYHRLALPTGVGA